MMVDAAQELIGGNKDIQQIIPKEDRAWTVENDLM
jgi:hypothetical protein